tara:strand:- start:512 stop:1741 length:1230 start_codon:yes stop_codon:yes gene_type:complete
MANGAPTVSNGLVISGVTTSSSINIADSIVHTGDTNTAIKFPANDTISFETSGNERLRITSAGNLALGNDGSFPIYAGANDRNFIIGTGSDDAAVNLYSGTTKFGGIYFGDGTSGGDRYVGYVEYKHDDDYLRIATNGAEKLRIDSSGRVLIGSIDGATHSDSSMDDLIIGSTANGKNDGLTILSGTAQNGSIAFADSGGAYQGLVGYVHNGDYLRFNTDGSERLRINKEGHLTTPSQAIFSARGQGSWNTFNSGSGWYNLGTSSYSGSNYYINHGWTTSGGGCGVRGVTSAGNSIWDNAAARFTAPVNGFYFFEISMYIRTNGGGKTFHVQPWLDSSNLNYYTSNIGNIRNSSNSLTGNTQQYPNSVMRSIVIYMAANQIFRWAVYSEGTTHFETHFDYAHQSGYLIG